MDNLDKWGIDRLTIVSPRLRRPLEWSRVTKPDLAIVTNLAKLVAPSSVLLTNLRKFGVRELKFLRSIDMSALELAEFPQEMTLSGCSFLESAILPTSLRVLPMNYFRSCWRLSHVGTSGCTALEGIEFGACDGCRSLGRFDFPRSIRVVQDAFCGTAIEEIDLSETAAELADFSDVIFLGRLTLPRRCELMSAFGFPALRFLAFGRASEYDFGFGSRLREVRFESFFTPPGNAADLESAYVHAETAVVFTRESNPSNPP
jgi:hypothetical protein